MIAAAAAHPERLVAYCRVNPHDDALAEAARALDAGARGIKLHPRAERFGMDEPVVAEPRRARAASGTCPCSSTPAAGSRRSGELTVRLAERHPGATLILAHAAISDLAWLWRVLPEHPNVLIDTAWWNPVDLVALFALAPPANIVWASDSPYGRPIASAVMAMRCALQAGLGHEAVRGIAGDTMARVLDGRAPADLGPPPGQPTEALDLLLERCHSHLAAGFAPLRRRQRLGGAGRARPARPARSARTGRTPTSSPPCSGSSTGSRRSWRRPSRGSASRSRCATSSTRW